MSEFTLSFGENIQQPEEIYPYRLEYLFAYMGYSEKNEWLIEDIREAEAKGDKEKKAELKKSLPYVIPSFLKKPNRNRKFFLKSNGFIFDADHLPDPEKTKNELTKNPYIHFAFLSPSGDGLKFGVKTNLYINTPEWYSKAYKYCAEQLKTHFRINLDKTSDCVRACFLSYDENIYWNKNSALWYPKFEMPKQEQYQQKEVSIDEEFNKCIEAARLTTVSDYQDWVTCMFALKNSFGDAGYEVFRALSFGKGYKDNENDLNYKWRTIPNNLSVGIGSFWHMIKKYGYKR